MRTLGLIVVLGIAAAGCGDDNAGGQDLSTPLDQSAAGDDLAGGSSDLAEVPDGGTISVDAGGTGTACMSACDCMPGLACFNGTCTTSGQPIYCCNSAVCPANQLCQSNAGKYGLCGGSSGMPDLAGFDHCPFVHCTGGSVQPCINAGCTQCVAGAGGMVCAK